MPTTVSTTPLNSSDTDMLNQCNPTRALSGAAGRIKRYSNLLSGAQAAQTKAQADLQTAYKKFLTSKNVNVPAGATITRQTVNNVDTLVVTTNP